MKKDADYEAELASENMHHHVPQDFRDRFALRLVKFLRVFADKFFAGRYSHRAVVLETVAAVPGMVGGLLQHLKALRHIRDDRVAKHLIGRNEYAEEGQHGAQADDFCKRTD